MRCDMVTCSFGFSARNHCATCASSSGYEVPKTAVTAACWMPRAARVLATWEISARSTARSGRPSYSRPPATKNAGLLTAARRSSGQSTIGGSDSDTGLPTLIAAAASRLRRSTRALVKAVVPMCTRSMA